MATEIEEFYSCLDRLEEAYQAELPNPQCSVAMDEARMKLELAVSKIETLLAQSNLHKQASGAQD